jgi:hypothetical protein
MRFMLLLLAVVPVPAQDYTFGTTVASSSGFQGNLYLLKPHTELLPNFKRMKPAGVIYTTRLNIPFRDFTRGFPGVTDRFEWFAIDYTARFWIEDPGPYRFRLLSDDGSRLEINGKLIIDNDGLHPAGAVDGTAEFSRGVHTIRVSYFQGPRQYVALVLRVSRPGRDEWEIFDTSSFSPPPDPALWIPGRISKIKRGSNW